MENPTRTLLIVAAVIVAGLIIISLLGFGWFQSCDFHAASPSGEPVPANSVYWTESGGAGDPVPAGEDCAAAVGTICDEPGDSCGIFGVCTQTVEVRGDANVCTCRCL